MWKKIAINVSIFLVLVITPLLFYYLQYSSLSETEKQERFLTEKFKIIAKSVASEKPEIIEVVNPDDYSNLNFHKLIKKGDYIFIYRNSRVGIFVDRDSERVIGTGEL